MQTCRAGKRSQLPCVTPRPARLAIDKRCAACGTEIAQFRFDPVVVVKVDPHVRRDAVLRCDPNVRVAVSQPHLLDRYEASYGLEVHDWS